MVREVNLNLTNKRKAEAESSLPVNGGREQSSWAVVL